MTQWGERTREGGRVRGPGGGGREDQGGRSEARGQGRAEQEDQGGRGERTREGRARGPGREG